MFSDDLKLYKEMPSLPSLTTILSVAFLGYMANSMWNIVQLYIPPTCPSGENQERKYSKETIIVNV